MEAVRSSETTRRYVSQYRNLQKHSSRYLNFVVHGFLAAVFGTVTFQIRCSNDDGKRGIALWAIFLVWHYGQFEVKEQWNRDA
jgi:hypothetical protein